MHKTQTKLSHPNSRDDHIGSAQRGQIALQCRNTSSLRAWDGVIRWFFGTWPRCVDGCSTRDGGGGVGASCHRGLLSCSASLLAYAPQRFDGADCGLRQGLCACMGAWKCVQYRISEWWARAKLHLQTWREAVQVSFVVLTTLFAWKKDFKNTKKEQKKKRPDCWRRKEQKRKQKRKEFDWIEKRIQ